MPRVSCPQLVRLPSLLLDVQGQVGQELSKRLLVREITFEIQGTCLARFELTQRFVRELR